MLWGPVGGGSQEGPGGCGRWGFYGCLVFVGSHGVVCLGRLVGFEGFCGCWGVLWVGVPMIGGSWGSPVGDGPWGVGRCWGVPVGGGSWGACRVHLKDSTAQVKLLHPPSPGVTSR